MSEEKKSSLFEDAIRHDVDTVNLLWLAEQRRRRILMAKIFIPFFIVVVVAVALIVRSRQNRIAELRALYEAQGEAVMAQEKVMASGAYNVLGYAKAAFRIKYILPPEAELPKEVDALLLEIADSNPSKVCMEFWRSNVVPKEEQALLAKANSFAMLINGAHEFSIALPDGKTEAVNTVFSLKNPPTAERVAALLNQEFAKLEGNAGQQLVDFKAYQAAKEAEKKMFEAANAAPPAAAPAGKTSSDEPSPHTILRKNFSLDTMPSQPEKPSGK